MDLQKFKDALKKAGYSMTSEEEVVEFLRTDVSSASVRHTVIRVHLSGRVDYQSECKFGKTYVKVRLTNVHPNVALIKATQPLGQVTF